MASCSVATSSPTTTTTTEIIPFRNYVVTKVIDGDTLLIDDVKVRLIGIDTPETVAPGKPVGCYGPEASNYMKAQLPVGTRVSVKYDKERMDRYGRTLVYLWRDSDGVFINGDLVQKGYAQTMTFRPNTARTEELVKLEATAKAAKAGLWGACSF